ncbi:MAG: Ku protein [Chloroflexota bacterium]|nr:Ku protein [Chloroflexota bacterium]
MVARSMWRGAIQFGLVTIPVKLYLATEPRGGLSFNLLHKECLNRIQMKTHCPEHGEISRSDTVRGFEWSKGQYVVIEEGDLESVPLKTLRAIEIEQFVEADREEFSTTFVKQAYYLEPEAVGRKAFYLLKSVLRESNLQAICKVVLKDRELLASLDPFSNTMLLSTLYWPDEVRDPGELELPEEDFDFKPAELTMAQQLVEAMKGDFDASRYHDEYREALMGVIEAKIDGQPVERPQPVLETSKLTDLMAVLEASVAAARKGRTGGEGDVAASDGADEKPAARGPARRSRAAASKEPTSVAEARKSRAAKPAAAKAAARKAATSKAADKPAAGKPAARTERKRKTA